MDLFKFDNDYRIIKGFNVLAGVDEAGRGPLAGPVVVSCVVLGGNTAINGLNDSKKLTAAKRESLFEEIREKALEITIEVIGNQEIDSLNIFNATMLGMKMSIEKIKMKVSAFLIDGNKAPSTCLNCVPIVAGDAKSACIAAASIIAKVTRDRIMKDFAVKFPQYQFDKHKGYGTKEHMGLIMKHGPCVIHRKSFEPVKSMRVALKPGQFTAVET